MSLFNSNSLYKDYNGRNTGHNTYIETARRTKAKRKKKINREKFPVNFIEYDKHYIKSLRKHNKHKHRHNNISDDSESSSESESGNSDEDNINIGAGNKNTILNKLVGKLNIFLDSRFGGADKIIKRETNNALSDDDIRDLLKNKTNIVLYEDLANVQDIEEILTPYDNCIILYQHAENFGHWVCLNMRTIKNNNKIIEFFDSYGHAPDEQLKFCRYISESLLKPLLEKTEYDVIYNPYKLQDDTDQNISSCGRWVVLRTLMNFMPLYDFVQLFKNNKKSPDYYATLLTTLLT